MEVVFCFRLFLSNQSFHLKLVSDQICYFLQLNVLFQGLVNSDIRLTCWSIHRVFFNTHINDISNNINSCSIN